MNTIKMYFRGILVWALFFGAMGCGDGPEKKAVIKVTKGMTAISVGRELYKKKVVRSLFWFRFAAKLNTKSAKIQTGYYEFSSRMRYSRMIDDMVNGRVKTVQITIRPGWSNLQIKRLLSAKKIMTDAQFDRYTRDPKLLAACRIPGKSVEGYLFPETYIFPLGVDAAAVIRKMTDTFFANIDRTYRAAARKTPYLGSLHKVLILASIVERETRAADERPKVASVFLNRLKIGKKLESCATIQYILGNPKAKLLLKDVRVTHPYNTYRNKGLPPGPICNPGKSAILAVLKPADTDYLFFVRNERSPDGRHFFSKTYQGHLTSKNRQ